MGTPTIVLARTDAEAADLLTSDVDENDKPFCTGERTPEGFYRTKPGVEQSISRGLAYAPYADMVLVRDGQAGTSLREGLRRGDPQEVPGQDAIYNCSPSFNWKKNSTTRRSASSSASWRDGLQVPVHHAGRHP